MAELAPVVADMAQYQIEGRDVLFRWLSRESNPERRHVMLDWLSSTARDPDSGAMRVPGIRAPIYLAVVPVRPPAVTRFLISEERPPG